MSWWTAEYGLVGTPENYKIYGAGLLSSLEEGRIAITDKVKKIPLSLECLNYSYNITEPQPQLFVARDMPHLHEVLDSVEKTMSYKRGGAYGLDKAKEAKATTTSVFETKLSVSGIVERYEVENNKVTFIKWMGPTQVCYNSKAIEGQGVSRHPEGFSGPLGRFKGRPDKASYNLTPGDLRSMNLIKGQRCKLELSTGFKIEGTLNDTLFIDRKLVLLSWSNCTVTKQGRTCFHPDWGEFDQFIAEEVNSISGGPADRNDFPEENKAEIDSNPAEKHHFSVDEINLFAEYEKLRKLRAEKKFL